MSPGRVPHCNGCGARIVFFKAPSSPKLCPFDPTPVTAAHPLAGVRAFPVLGGAKAYRPSHLTELLQVQRSCTDAAAAEEVRDLPWHLIHDCSTDSTPDTPKD